MSTRSRRPRVVLLILCLTLAAFTTAPVRASSFVGQTYWADGTTAPKSEPSGTPEISAYAVDARPGATYLLVTGLNGCTTDIRVSSTNVLANQGGVIPTTTGRVREGPFARVDGTYDVCFVLAANYGSPTAPLRFAVGRSEPTTTTTRTGPSPQPNVCSISPANGEAAIAAAIASCPNGTATARTIVRFPAQASYTTNGRIEVVSRRHITMDLNGSTIRNMRDNNDLSGLYPNFYIVHGEHLTITNGKLVGNFSSCGTRNLGTLCGYHNPHQANAGVSFFGGKFLEASRLDIREVMGEGVAVQPAWIVDTSVPHPKGEPEDVNIHHNKITTAARMGITVTAGFRVTVADNELHDIWYGGIDAEIDNNGTMLHDLKILRNKLNGFNVFGIGVPAFGGTPGNVQRVEIRGNELLTPQDQCTWGFLINHWEVPDATAYDIRVADNIIRYRNMGLVAVYVDGGGVTNNTFIWHSGCSRQVLDIRNVRNFEVSGNIGT